jgi:CopG family transcriptional regulator, nickel-responsive regulator
MVKEMDEVQQALGFTGRSELVRAGIRLLLQDVKEKASISGRVTAVVVVTHSEENEGPVTKIKHKYDRIVRTHIHNKVGKNNCVELFLVEGLANGVASMTHDFQKEDGIRSVKLVVL